MVSIAAAANHSSVGNPAPPAAIAALRAQPGFAAAMRASAAGLVAMYQGSQLLNWLMDDRGRLMLGYFALYLDATREPADPTSGITPTRMKALCAEFDVCSPGRASAMLSLMRYAGYLRLDAPSADLRQRRLVATERLFELLRTRWRLHFGAMAPLMPDGAALCAALDDPAFCRRMVIAMMARFRAGFRFITHAPEMGIFGERAAGMLIVASLLTAGEADDTMPPSRPVPVSISALARRFAVSRPHVLKLIRDAEAEGTIARTSIGGSFIAIQPALAEAAQNLFAAMLLFYADCAHEALRAAAHLDKAG